MSDQSAYDEIDRLRRRLRAIENAAGINPEPPTYSSAQLEDRRFYKKNEADILAAAREPGTPRIVESEPEEPPPPVVWPDSGDPRLTPKGQNIFESAPLQSKERDR
jgi:hypothetical protein